MIWKRGSFLNVPSALIDLAPPSGRLGVGGIAAAPSRRASDCRSLKGFDPAFNTLAAGGAAVGRASSLSQATRVRPSVSSKLLSGSVTDVFLMARSREIEGPSARALPRRGRRAPGDIRGIQRAGRRSRRCIRGEGRGDARPNASSLPRSGPRRHQRLMKNGPHYELDPS